MIRNQKFPERSRILGALVIACFLWCRPISGAGQAAESTPTQQLESCAERGSCSSMEGTLGEIARRGDLAFLVRIYRRSNVGNQEYIAGAVYISGRGSRNQQIVKFMRQIAFGPSAADAFSRKRWCALQFLAESCDASALAELKRGGATKGDLTQYPVSCWEWAQTLDSFGKCRYFPAARTLVNSVPTMCLDVGNAALDSLNLLYPGRCSSIKDVGQLRACYARALAASQK